MIRPILVISALLIASQLLLACKTNQNTSSTKRSTVTARIVHSPGLTELLAPLRSEFLQAKPVLSDNRAVEIELIARPEFLAAEEIASGELKVTGWLSTTPLISYANAHRVNLGPEQNNCTRLFVSPVVVAVPRSKLQFFNPEGQVLSWNALFSDLNNLNRSAQNATADDSAVVRRTANSSVGLFLSDPQLSSAGLPALLQLSQLASKQRGENPEARKLTDVVIAQISEYMSFSAGYGVDDYSTLKRTLQSNSSHSVSFAVTTEQVLSDFNKHTSSAGASPLMALYFESGTYWQTHSLCLSDADWVEPPERAIVREFVAHVLNPASQLRVKQAGYRPATKQALPVTAPLTAAYGVDLNLPQRSLAEPSTLITQELLSRWEQFKRPAAVLLVMDSSGSTEGAVLSLGQNELRKIAASASARRHKVGLLTFSAEPKLVVNLSTEFGPLINAIDLIKSHGGSAIYDAVRKASEVMLRLPNDEYRKIIVLYTDGGDVNSRNTLAMLREFLTRRLQRASIDLIVVGVSGNTRLDDLRSLAEAANGTFFEATLDSVPDVFRKVRAML